MDLRQLRYLVAVADELHFTRAAAREHVAQPALSQQIRRLEREVGLPLLERTTRRVALTEAGAVLVARARRVLAEIEAAQAELGALAGVRAGRVVIGATSTLGAVDLSRLLVRYGARHPGVEFSVVEGGSEGLAGMLRDDAVDVAFLSVTEGMDRGGLALHRLVEEELVVLLPDGHPLAGRPAVALAELRDESFMAFRPGARLRELLVGAAAEAGFTPRLAFETDQVARIRTMVARGLGVALVPESDAADAPPGVAVVRLEGPALVRDVTLAWREQRRLAPAARAFLELARAG